ncbi:MAG: HPr(Ser) kinase/phosphatase [Oscillospiraceae bacterium]|jgi:HPr kinase/phosphorylase|nr:HPr(Ser) kinase/phosphatase [Oscillospiraceae bacterium]
MNGHNKSVKLPKIIDGLPIKMAYLPPHFEEIQIYSKNVHKVGLCLVGFFNDFEKGGIYLLGNEEMHYLGSLSHSERQTVLDKFFRYKPSLVIATNNWSDMQEINNCAKKHKVAYATSDESTSEIVLKILKFLDIELAPMLSLHGELIVVYGEGVLIMGESGIGKSETVIELIRRGHHLVADDLVDVRKISHNILTGTAPNNIRYFVELRGIGIINAEKMFGIDAVKMSSQIDLVIEMMDIKNSNSLAPATYDDSSTTILGVALPVIKIPVKSGQNMTTLIEAATMANKQKKFGYNARKELAQILKTSQEREV